MAKLYGVDVFSGEGRSILTKIKYDFAIVKVSGNPQNYAWNYTNPYASRQAKDCMNKTGLLGLYHFTWGKENPNVEADFFINEVKKLGYLGKAMLVIDYEAQAVNRGRTWVKKFAERIYEKAGYKPVIYASGSVIAEQDLDSLGYPIWEASYPSSKTIHGYNPPSGKVWCKSRIMWQFTGTGRLNGYSGNLDLNVFFGDEDDFRSYMGKSKDTSKKEKTITDIAKEVIAGKWGNRETRRMRLIKAGYDYKEVQSKVNSILYNKVANDVIAGKYGNGEERKKALKKAGYDYDKVQALVNKKVK